MELYKIIRRSLNIPYSILLRGAIGVGGIQGPIYVYPLVLSPIVVTYIIPYMTPSREFRLWPIWLNRLSRSSRAIRG